jgi:hypothetical protein
VTEPCENCGLAIETSINPWTGGVAFWHPAGVVLDSTDEVPPAAVPTGAT